MTEGSIFGVFNFPEEWPIKENSIVFSGTASDSKIQILSISDGRLEFHIDDYIFKTQKIIFTNAYRALISCHWNINNANFIEVYINSVKISDFNNLTIFPITSKHEIDKVENSIGSKDIKNACFEWMEWRKHRYSSLKQIPKKGRIKKSFSKQLNELNDAIESLKSHRITFRKNESLYLINILPILRSLLFWPDKQGNYNPLLIRITGILELPLPIFALNDRIKETKDDPLFKDAISHKVHNCPTIFKKHRNEVLLDLQEWLNMEVIIERNSESTLSFRWKDILFEAANTSSAAHFDDDIPIFLAGLNETIVWNRSHFLLYIESLVDVTIVLGQYIIKNAIGNEHL